MLPSGDFLEVWRYENSFVNKLLTSIRLEAGGQPGYHHVGHEPGIHWCKTPKIFRPAILAQRHQNGQKRLGSGIISRMGLRAEGFKI